MKQPFSSTIFLTVFVIVLVADFSCVGNVYADVSLVKSLFPRWLQPTVITGNGEYAYLVTSRNDRGLISIMDIRDSTDYSEVGSYRIDSDILSLQMGDNWLWVVHTGGVSALDLTNPLQPQLLGTYSTDQKDYPFAIDDRYTYHCIYEQGIEVVDWVHLPTQQKSAVLINLAASPFRKTRTHLPSTSTTVSNSMT